MVSVVFLACNLEQEAHSRASTVMDQQFAAIDTATIARVLFVGVTAFCGSALALKTSTLHKKVTLSV
jgi:hypothetical protein